MEVANGAGGGESGNQLPPIRRRPRTPKSQPQPQGNQTAPRPTNQARPADPRSTRPRNAALPRQPRPGHPNPTTATAQQDNGHGYGHEPRYGNTYNIHQGHVQPHQNANPSGQYQESHHVIYGNTAAAYGQGYGDLSHQAGEAYDGSAYGGGHGAVWSYGEANGTGAGYGVQGMNGMSEKGGEQQLQGPVGPEQHQPSERCMQCVHGIAVPIATITTRAVFKGTRCIACMCTIL